MHPWAIAAAVVGGVLAALALAWAFAAWYTWRRVTRVDPSIPRVAVDPREYAGRWYEIARYPQWFERGCARATADYAPTASGLSVTNSCERNGERTSATGAAYATSEPGVLGVSFFPGLYGAYVVAYRDPQTSVVTNQDRSALWVLSRTPTITTAHRDQVWRWLRDNQFDTQKFE